MQLNKKTKTKNSPQDFFGLRLPKRVRQGDRNLIRVGDVRFFLNTSRIGVHIYLVQNEWRDGPGFRTLFLLHNNTADTPRRYLHTPLVIKDLKKLEENISYNNSFRLKIQLILGSPKTIGASVVLNITNLFCLGISQTDLKDSLMWYPKKYNDHKQFCQRVLT